MLSAGGRDVECGSILLTRTAGGRNEACAHAASLIEVSGCKPITLLNSTTRTLPAYLQLIAARRKGKMRAFRLSSNT